MGSDGTKATGSLIYYNIQVTLKIITFPIILFNRTVITIVLYSKLNVIVRGVGLLAEEN